MNDSIYHHVCLFCGHRDADEALYSSIFFEVERVIVKYGVNEFWSGSNGRFDHMGERAVRALKCKYHHIKLVRVLAYRDTNTDSHGFDELYYPEIGKVPAYAAIVKRNSIIACQTGYVIAYVVRNYGGAASMLERAIKCGAVVIRINS